MGTPIAFTSGSTNTFNLGTTKRETIALNPATSLTSGFNWFNGVDVSATQYLIYSDTFSQGQATIANARPTAWTTPDLSDASLLALINTLPDRVGLNGFTDINVALQWLEDSEKYFLIKGGYNNIVTSNLVVNLDAGWANSYPGSATNWNDLSSSNLDGTLINGVSFSTDGGGSLQTDGVDDYVVVGAVPNTGNPSASLTWELWVNPADTDGNIMSMSATNPQGSWNMPPIAARGGVFQAKIWNNSALSDTVGYTQGTWYHLVLVWNYATQTQLFYVNGVLKSSEAGIEYDASGVNNYLFLGQSNPGADNAGMFAGKFGQFRVYNKALSSVEVLQNFNATSARYGYGGQSLFAGVTQYLDFSKSNSYPGSGTFVTDITGNGNDATFNNGSFTTFNGVKCFNATSASSWLVSDPVTLGSNYTIFIWANMLAKSQVSTWRTLVRSSLTPPGEDHELIVEYSSNLLGYFDNENGTGFNSYGINVADAGLENNWILYTLVGENATSQKVYINDGTTNASLNRNAGGQQIIGIGNYQGGSQEFGYVANYILYNNQAFTQSQVSQYFDATKQYYGYASNNTISYGLVMSLDAAEPISYPGSGLSWYDLSPFGNTVTLTNGASFSNIGGGSIAFDGTDDYAVAAGSSSTNISDFLTAEVWVYYESGDGRILQKDDWNTGAYTRCWEIGGYAGQFRIEMWHSNGSGTLAYGNPLTVNGWTHLVMTFDGTNIRLYQNSILISTVNFPGDIRTDINTPITLGGRWSTSEYLDGNIGVARIYNRALSASEILQNFNTQKSRFGL
jgi:hypothetical protein